MFFLNFWGLRLNPPSPNPQNGKMNQQKNGRFQIDDPIKKLQKYMSLTFGGRGSYLPFYSYNLGGWTPPVYYVLKKWTPPVDYNLKKRGPTQTWKFAKKKTKFTIKRQVPFFWCFVWPIYSVYFVSIKGQGWTPPVYYNLTRRSL